MVQLRGAFESVADLLREQARLDEFAVELGGDVAVAGWAELFGREQGAGAVEHREVDAVHRAEPHVLLDEQPGLGEAFFGLGKPEVDEGLGFGGHGSLHVEVADVEGVFFDELPAGCDLIAHEDGEDVVGVGGIAQFDLEHLATFRVHGGFPELFGVHFA